MHLVHRLSARAAAFGVAAAVTLTVLVGIDTLATGQHAATTLAKSQPAKPEAARTAAAKASGQRG